jgi:repressor LexA
MYSTHYHELSDHDARMLTFIERYAADKSRAPSVEEIRVAMHMASKDHVQRDLIRLDSIGYIRRTPKISRGIELLRTATGYDMLTGTLAVPMVGVIAAGLPIPVPDPGPSVYDSLELTRDIVRDTRGVYALRVKGTSMIDALINDGDIVIMRRVADAENGDMVAVWIKSQEATTLKRFYHEGARVRLQPENQSMEPIYVDPTDIEVQGKVIAVIRHV